MPFCFPRPTLAAYITNFHVKGQLNKILAKMTSTLIITYKPKGLEAIRILNSYF